MRFTLMSVLSSIFFLNGCSGCGYLNPEKVRELMASPTGSVEKGTMAHAAHGYFDAQDGVGAEFLGFSSKGYASGDSTDTESGSQLLLPTQIDKRIQRMASDILSSSYTDSLISKAGIGDAFCATGFILDNSNFSSCDLGQNCESRLVLDSCLLKLGEDGDQYARGKIIFKTINSTTSEFDRQLLELEFEDFELTSSIGDYTGYFDGLIALEVSRYEADNKEELILSTDFRTEERTFERGLFHEDTLSQHRVTGALRFTHQSSGDVESGTVEVLAFIDEDPDARDNAIVLEFTAEDRNLSDDNHLTTASLTARGQNGSFECTWSRAEQELESNGAHIISEGHCTDEVGEVFEFSSEFTTN